MLNSFPAALLVGMILGFLSGLGVGGGSLLMVWLTLVLGIDPAIARNLNLMFFLPAALSSVFMRSQNGEIPWKKIIPAVFSGCIAAVISARLGENLDTDLLRKLFGGLLIITGLREIFQGSEEQGSHF